MMYRLNIWSRLTHQLFPAGEMVCEISTNGRPRCEFRYASEFLADSSSFPLDPTSLPLNTSIFPYSGIAHPVFEDSLPDDWGKRLLIRKHRPGRRDQNTPNMLAVLGSSGLGALVYSLDNTPPLILHQSPTILNLGQLIEDAEKFERGEPLDTETSLLFSAGSSPGGARPKTLILDEDGSHCIAKLPSSKDTVDVVRIEAATMSLAKKAGIPVPGTRVVQCGARPALLVERFDIIPTGRRHMISMQSLLKAEGYYVCRYKELLDMVRRYSAAPSVDSANLFRQMVFNALIGNTDDHLKNFWMTYGENDGWRLSPAFDLVPDIARRGEHILLFDLDPYCPGIQKLSKLGKAWGISRAGQLVDSVVSALSDWQQEYHEHGVTDQDIRPFLGINDRLSSGTG